MAYTSKFDAEKYTAIFPSRLRDLMDQHKEMTISAIASKLGISTAAVGAYKRGETMPKLEYAQALADCFNVSLDYLTGRSDIPSRNETLQSVGAYTGLWEQAIATLHTEQFIRERDLQDFISYLITHPSLPDLIDALKQKNSFANTGEKVPVDVGKSRRVYEVEVEAVCKKIADDILRDIIDGYTVKFGEVLVDHVTG